MAVERLLFVLVVVVVSARHYRSMHQIFVVAFSINYYVDESPFRHRRMYASPVCLSRRGNARTIRGQANEPIP